MRLFAAFFSVALILVSAPSSASSFLQDPAQDQPKSKSEPVGNPNSGNPARSRAKGPPIGVVTEGTSVIQRARLMNLPLKPLEGQAQEMAEALFSPSVQSKLDEFLKKTPLISGVRYTGRTTGKPIFLIDARSSETRDAKTSTLILQANSQGEYEVVNPGDVSMGLARLEPPHAKTNTTALALTLLSPEVRPTARQFALAAKGSFTGIHHEQSVFEGKKSFYHFSTGDGWPSFSVEAIKYASEKPVYIVDDTLPDNGS